MPRCFARGRRTWPGRCRRPCVRGDGREGDTPGDIRRAVEIALHEWPNKSQQEIAEQIGCGQGTVAKVKADIIPRNIIPPTRTDSMGRTRPTTYATRTTRTATSTTFNPERPSTCARVRAMQPDSTLAGNTDRPPSGESSVAGCPTGRRINRAAMWPSSGLATWPSSSPSSSSTGTSMDQDRRRGRCSGVRRGS